jgi:hypothetical protein
MGAPTLLALLALAAAATAQSTDTEPCWYDAEGDFVKTCASDAEIDVGLCECRVRLTDVSCTSAELTKSTCPDAGHSEPEDTSNLPCCRRAPHKPGSQSLFASPAAASARVALTCTASRSQTCNARGWPRLTQLGIPSSVTEHSD